MKRTVFLVMIIAVPVVTAWVLWPQAVRGHEVETTTVQFDREIVGILNRRCVMCHSEGNLSFPLETYEQTWLRGRPIRTQVIARHMPPWSAVPGYGEFSNDNSLTLREIQFIVSWVEGRGPRNAGRTFLNVVDPDTTPPEPVRAHAHFGHWHLGEPSLARQLAANTIDAGEPNVTKRSVVDLGLTAERWIRGLEYLPGDRRVVRAAFFTLQETGQWLGSWTPWHGFVSLPPGVAYRVSAGSHIVAEIHYTGAEEQVIEQGTLGLFFTDERSLNSPSDVILEVKGAVPAGTARERFRAETQLATDTYVLALWPEVQPGIRSVEASARMPDGRIKILLFAKDISMDWPTPYVARQPVLLPRGSELSVTAYYANDAAQSQPGGIRLTVSAYDGKNASSTTVRRCGGRRVRHP